MTDTAGDGNGWVQCALGHRHWGRFGAAGLLLTDGTHVLLQHRSPWTHEGDTWAVPGGARDSDEEPLDAALREAVEETSLDPHVVEPEQEWVDDHGGWSYTTILARTAEPVEIVPVNAESTELHWWSLDQVSALHLHRGFARTWPTLRAMIGTAVQ